MDVKIYPAVERTPTTIPIQDVLSPDGIPHIFPEVTSRGYFDIDFRGNKLVLIAGKYIGLIPINERVAINVQPKVGVANLVHIISKSKEQLDALTFFERTYKHAATVSQTIFEFLARSLAIALQTIDKEGMYKQYLGRHANVTAPKGRINIARTAQLNWMRGIYYKVFIDWFEFTADNHFNRMVKYSLWYCLNHLMKIGSTNVDLIKELSYFYDFFMSIPLDKNRNFLQPVIDDIHDQKIPVLRAYYENICKICRVIIEDIGITLTEPGEDIKLLSFIINMEHIFERYLLFILREKNHFFGEDYRIQDGNKEGKRFLLSDPSKFEAKPDIIINHLTGAKLIMDAKYKDKATESDRYQIISHALSFGANKAILVMPLSERSASGLLRQGRIGEPGIEIYEYYFNLENEDLESEEANYVQVIRDLCLAA